MFIHKTKSRKSTCFQPGEKQAGRFILRQHVGCASTPTGIIVGARIKNLSQELTQKILNHRFSRQSLFQTETGNQRLIVNYSPKRANRDARNRERTIAKLKQKSADGKAVIRKSKYLRLDSPNQIRGIDQAKIAAVSPKTSF